MSKIILLVLMVLILYYAMRYLKGSRNVRSGRNSDPNGFIVMGTDALIPAEQDLEEGDGADGERTGAEEVRDPDVDPEEDPGTDSED